MLARGLRLSLILAVASAAFIAPSLAFAVVGWPVNLAIVGNVSTNDTTPTFTWSPAGGATWYDYKIDNGSYVGIGNVQAVTVSPQENGWHTLYLRGHNNKGEIGAVRSVTFEIDTAGPTVPAVTPGSATEDVPVNFSVTPSGEAATVTCSLYVGGAYAGAMAKVGSTFTKSYTFAHDGSYTVHAVCTDGDANTTSGTSRTVRVSDQVSTPPTDNDDDEEPVDDDADEGDLIKIECASGAGVNDPCTAVYYWGKDGRRHPFPNESVFFTWYEDFEDVAEVSAEFMRNIPMGETVTYKPGTVVVKFDSSDKVYAVEEGGVLRHYLTPSLVASDYGSDWKTNDLVTVSDAFFSDYFIGPVIDSSSDYDPESAEDGVTSIDDNF